MKTNRFRKGAATLVAASLMLVGTALPAAAIAAGSVSLDTPDVYANATDARLTFTVNNAAPSTGIVNQVTGTDQGSNIDLVQFVPPVDLFKAGYDVAEFTAPEGWQVFVQSDIVRFRTTDATKEIEPGKSKQFTLEYDIKPQPQDASDYFFVSLSDDGGTTLTSTAPQVLNVRTLKLIDGTLTVTKPVAAVDRFDNMVTAQQNNAAAALSVVNLGSAKQTVTATVSKARGGSSFTTASSSAVEILPGVTHPFTDIPAAFGNAGTGLILKGAATSSGSSTVNTVESAAITVQQPIALSYRANTLTPNAINNTESPTVSFSLKVDKTGGPSAGTNPLTTKLKFDSVNKSGTFNVGAQDQSAQDMFFPNTDVSGSADGTYSATVTYGGGGDVDANGALVPEVTLATGNVLIDKLKAILNVTLTPPTTRVPGETDAATFNNSLTVGGSAMIGTNACTQCQVVSTKVTIGYGASEANYRVLDGATATVNISSTTGALSGSVKLPNGTPETPGNLRATDTNVRLEVTVRRVINGIPSTNTTTNTGAGATDFVRPAFTENGTKTGRDADGDYVDVVLANGDRIGFSGQLGSQPGDWLVDGGAVTEVSYPCTGCNAKSTTTIRLRTLETLENNATPVVTYDPPVVVSAPGYDRVNLTLVYPTAVNAADGIAPDTIDLATISTYRESLGRGSSVKFGLQDGKFYTRDRTPTATITEVLPNDFVTIYEDVNNDGVHNAGEQGFGTVRNGNTQGALEVPITLPAPGASGVRTFNIGAYVSDSNGNKGLSVKNIQLVLDEAPLKVASFSHSGTSVTVTFDNAITAKPDYTGRNAAMDWFVKADGRWRPVETVTTGSSTTRVLNLSAFSVPAGSTITDIRYEYVSFGPEETTSKRYMDYALNIMNDGVFASS